MKIQRATRGNKGNSHCRLFSSQLKELFCNCPSHGAIANSPNASTEAIDHKHEIREAGKADLVPLCQPGFSTTGKCSSELSSSLLKIIPAAEGETEDLDDADRGVGWLRGPEAGLEAEENGSAEGRLCELLPAAEAATAVNLETASEQPAVR